MLELCWKCGYDHLPPVGENCTGLVKPRIVLRSRLVTGRSKDIITVQTAHEGEGAMAEGTSNVTPAEPHSEELSLIAEPQEAERCQRKLRLKARIKELLIKKHRRGSMRGGVRPNGGGYDPNPKGEGRYPRQWAVHPPEYFP